MFRIIKNLLVALLVLAATGPGATGAAAAAAGSWENGDSSVFTSPKSFIDYNAAKGDRVKPLPAAGSRQPRPDALSLSWKLRVPGLTQDGPVAQNANAPGWLQKSRLLLCVTISPQVTDSYFYAPFSLDLNLGERRMAADASMPVRLELTDENGDPVSEAPFYYPPGSLKQDAFSGLRTPAYQDEIMAAAAIPEHLSGRELRLKISALVCTATSCTPFRKIYALPLNDGGSAAEPLAPALLASLKDYRTAPFGPQPDPELARTFSGSAGQGASESRLLAYIDSLSPRYQTESLEVDNLWQAVTLGLLAGLILNFMPCVLPVISLKLGAMLGLGGWSGLEKNSREGRLIRRRFRLYGFCFTLGVLAWFGLLFGAIGFTGRIWGQFFQSQEMILGLSILLFVMALSMFGLVRLPLLSLRAEASSSLPGQAFFGGFLATLLATPCSGPLLGGVLGWAVNESPLYLGVTLFSVGAGMSSPFILMALSPGLARFLPKPGPWTVTLERVMGFVLMGTVIYLISMLAQARVVITLSALLLLAFSAWVWSRPTPAAKNRLSLGRIFALVLLVPALYLPFAQRAADTGWKTFSPAAFLSGIGQKNLLLDFTADWCINCRAMEAATLTERRLQRWGLEYNLTFVKVDLTGDNEAGFALLRGMGSASIPLLAVIPAADPQNPVVLRDLVTPAQLEQALKQAFRPDIHPAGKNGF